MIRAMWDNATLVHRPKSIEKILKKMKIDTINWKKIFDKSADHK